MKLGDFLKIIRIKNEDAVYVHCYSELSKADFMKIEEAEEFDAISFCPDFSFRLNCCLRIEAFLRKRVLNANVDYVFVMDRNILIITKQDEIDGQSDYV